MIAGTEEQKRRYLPGICEGTQRAAFGLSEPQAGSDVMGMRTGCPDAGSEGGWVLNGAKCWMSGVREADWYTVFAKTSDPASRPTTRSRRSSWSGRGTAWRSEAPTTKWACAGSTPVSSS